MGCHPRFVSHFCFQLTGRPSCISDEKSNILRGDDLMVQQKLNPFEISTPKNPIRYFHTIFYQITFCVDEMNRILLYWTSKLKLYRFIRESFQKFVYFNTQWFIDNKSQ